MKRKIALLLCMLLLCGCNGNVSENIPNVPTNDISDITEGAETLYTRESVQSAEEATQTAPAPIETTATAEPEIEFDDLERITPRLSPEKVTCTLSCGVSAEKIIEYAGYDIDFDVTTLDYYESIVDLIESDCEGEKLEKLRSRHYMTDIYPQFCYMGTEEADWLATVSYGLYGVQGAFMERLFLIKDGEVVRELEPLEDWILAAYFDRGEIFLSGAGSGLRKTDIATGKSPVILEQDVENDGWGMIAAINEKYIVYGGSMQKILVRETGEIIYPDINWNGMDNLPLILSGDTIDYTDRHGEHHSYDIESRTMTNGDKHNLAKIKGYDYTDKWSVTAEFAGFPAIRVVNLYDGTERVYDLRPLVGEISEEELFRYNTNYVFDDDRLWLCNRNGQLCFVLNLNTGEAAEVANDFNYDFYWYDPIVSDGILRIMDRSGEDQIHIAEVDYPV